MRRIKAVAHFHRLGQTRCIQVQTWDWAVTNRFCKMVDLYDAPNTCGPFWWQLYSTITHTSLFTGRPLCCHFMWKFVYVNVLCLRPILSSTNMASISLCRLWDIPQSIERVAPVVMVSSPILCLTACYIRYKGKFSRICTTYMNWGILSLLTNRYDTLLEDMHWTVQQTMLKFQTWNFVSNQFCFQLWDEPFYRFSRLYMDPTCIYTQTDCACMRV